MPARLFVMQQQHAIMAKYIQFIPLHAKLWTGYDLVRLGVAIYFNDSNVSAPALAITKP